MRRVEIKVSIILPTNASLKDARDYVIDAVASMKGCYRPPGSLGDDDDGDPMFSLDGDTVKASVVRKKRKKRGTP